MATESHVFDQILSLGATGRGVYLLPPCDEASIEKMQEHANQELGAQIPAPFVHLLRISNGLQINGAYFKKAEHIVPDNLDADREEVIILGNEGNMVEFVFDRRDRKYHTINMGFPDERFSSYETFDDMLLDVLKEQQII